MSSQRNKQIEGLRAISILLLMIYHYIVRYQEIYVAGYTYTPVVDLFSDIGVFTFFLITGLYLEKSRGIKLFTKRLISIWPRYFLAITIIFLITRIVELPGRTCTFKQYLLNIPFLNGFIGSPFVDGAHWFLRTLLIAFAVYSIITLFSDKTRDWLYVAILSGMLILAAARFVPSGGSSLINTAKSLASKAVDLVNVRIVLIVLGTLIAKNKWTLPNLISCILIAAILFTVGLSKDLNSNANRTMPVTVEYMLDLAGCTAIVWLAFRQKLGFLEWKPLLFIGAISYPLFLLHQNIGFIILRAMGEYRAWMIVVPMAIVIVFAYLFELLGKRIDLLFKKS